MMGPVARQLLRHFTSPRTLPQLPRRLQQFRSINIFSMFSKEAVQKERLRLMDELHRGYFDDLRDLKKHGGKLARASESLIPIEAAMTFPTLIVSSKSGKRLTLSFGEDPIHDQGRNQLFADVTFVCMAFRSNAKAMVESWSSLFLDAFKDAKKVRMYEVSYIDSWLLSLQPFRWFLLRAMHSSQLRDQGDVLKVFYGFGDTYDLRKSLQITNLLTGHGRIRWQASGHATEEELSSMVSCTLKLLEEQRNDL